MRQDQPGISNRETFVQEQQERMEFPRQSPDAPPVEQDAAGREGEEHPEANEGRHTSHNAMWETNHLMMFNASVEWLTKGAVNGAKNGVLRLGFPNSTQQH